MISERAFSRFWTAVESLSRPSSVSDVAAMVEVKLSFTSVNHSKQAPLLTIKRYLIEVGIVILQW